MVVQAALGEDFPKPREGGICQCRLYFDLCACTATRVRLKGMGTRLAGWALGALGSLRVGTAAACCFPRSLRRRVIPLRRTWVSVLLYSNRSAKLARNS